MKKKKILLINGPNLNLLGQRESIIYGSTSFNKLNKYLKTYCLNNNCNIKLFQSNSESEIIDKIQKARNIIDGIIINAGAYTHTSIAILDALRSFQGLIYEVHISNIYNREPYRRNSYISEVSHGVICGLGVLGYEVAIDAVLYN